MSQLLPPFSLPNFDHLASSSTPHGNSELSLTSAAGFELIVWGLDRSSQLSAQSDFVVMYEEVFEHALMSQTYLPSPSDIVVVPGDRLRAVDYVFVSLSSPEPRPDIMNSMRHAILAHGKAKAEWKVARGYDRTRRGFFRVDDIEDAEGMEDKIADALNATELTFQFHTTITCGQSRRVAFDFIDAASIERLESTPLVLDQHVLPIFRPRYIVPQLGYDVVVTGCDGIQGMQRAMDAIIRNMFGSHSIAHSRMELDGDAYVVVMNNLGNAARLVDSDLPLPNGVPPFVPISKPMYLSLYNLRGCPASPTDYDGKMSSPSIKSLQRQIRCLQDQILHANQTVQSAVQAHARAVAEIYQEYVALQNAFVMSLASQTAMQRLSAIQNELNLLRTERSSKELFICLAPSEKVRLLMTDQVSALDRRIELQDNLRAEATSNYMLLANKMAAFVTPSPESGQDQSSEGLPGASLS
ncbi:hypothetical protein EV421DRAFT_646961 [Armillaria borealis]|uniref:Uncharacterized protein n=1 Tax=Armillaria borealis TaxID=47425 RepID=A0AA39K206_9AGAR|nr:hypothetical protein EV421DRAFT_646961 [Armillaria borealis]